jgi:hypothetical protein
MHRQVITTIDFPTSKPIHLRLTFRPLECLVSSRLCLFCGFPKVGSKENQKKGGTCLQVSSRLEYHNFLDHPFIDFEQFNEMCRKVYFATEDYSLSTFALVNGGLFFLFKEIAFVQGKNVPEAAENAALCRANLEYAISNFNIFMAPTDENLQAILLGVSGHSTVLIVNISI